MLGEVHFLRWARKFLKLWSLFMMSFSLLRIEVVFFDSSEKWFFRRCTDASSRPERISMQALKLFSFLHSFATWMKCVIASTRAFCSEGLSTSEATQPLTILKRSIIILTLGAFVSPSFLLHARPRHSFGRILRKISISFSVSWRASSTGWRSSRPGLAFVGTIGLGGGFVNMACLGVLARSMLRATMLARLLPTGDTGFTVSSTNSENCLMSSASCSKSYQWFDTQLFSSCRTRSCIGRWCSLMNA
mmetsp:Transcript_330/g.1154  ORF Transcript_330/g.1154 Transcript_330/m.1154 type:complete len:247 (-) Transcript_330:1425-2165(-)